MKKYLIIILILVFIGCSQENNITEYISLSDNVEIEISSYQYIIDTSFTNLSINIINKSNYPIEISENESLVIEKKVNDEWEVYAKITDILELKKYETTIVNSTIRNCGKYRVKAVFTWKNNDENKEEFLSNEILIFSKKIEIDFDELVNIKKIGNPAWGTFTETYVLSERDEIDSLFSRGRMKDVDSESFREYFNTKMMDVDFNNEMVIGYFRTSFTGNPLSADSLIFYQDTLRIYYATYIDYGDPYYRIYGTFVKTRKMKYPVLSTWHIY